MLRIERPVGDSSTVFWIGLISHANARGNRRSATLRRGLVTRPPECIASSQQGRSRVRFDGIAGTLHLRSMSQDYQVRQSPDKHQQVAHLRHPMPHPELPRQDRAFLGGRCGGIPLPVQLHQFGLQPKPARTHQRQDSNQTPTRTPSQGRTSSARSQMQNERHHCADHLQHKVLSQHRLSDEPRILSPDEIRHRRREEVGAHHDFHRGSHGVGSAIRDVAWGVANGQLAGAHRGFGAPGNLGSWTSGRAFLRIRQTELVIGLVEWMRCTPAVG